MSSRLVKIPNPEQKIDCSIIVLNYFGEKVLSSVLDSLLDMDFPKRRFEIIIVDNASTDGSKEIINSYVKKDRRIKALYLDRNYGFSKGNNEGIKIASGKYIALLNNDCVVDKNWLSQMVRSIEKEEEIFAVNSKIKLYPRFFNVQFSCPKSVLIEECYMTGSNLCKFELENKVLIYPEYKDNFYSLEIPFDPLNDHNIVFEMKFNKSITNKTGFEILNLTIGNYSIMFKKNSMRVVVKAEGKAVEKNSYDLIQNAGIVMFQDGSGRDIGAIVKENKQSYERDLGQFDQEKEVYAACAAAVLYRKDILEKVGCLDDTFFMYYEDVDLSERARFVGYKVVYNPKAVVRHMHSLSSKEWSSFFMFNAQKGRLLHIFFNFPFTIFLREFGSLLFKAFLGLLKVLVSPRMFRKLVRLIMNQFKGRKDKKSSGSISYFLQYIKVISFFILNSPILLIKRAKKRSMFKAKVVDENYKSIVSGRWYFND